MFAGTLGAALLALVFDRPALTLGALVLLLAWTSREALLRWTTGISVLLVVLVFVPSRIYKLPLALPFDVDPYRLVLMLLLVAWLVRAVVRRRLFSGRTYLDAAIGIFLLAMAVSFAANAARFTSPDEFAYRVKMGAYLASFPLTFYLIASTVRSPKEVLRLIDVLVVCGAVAGAFGVVERVTQFNLFYHLESIVPLLRHVASPGAVLRGSARVAGSTAHPIAFATLLSMLLPLAAARAFSAPAKRARWAAIASCGLIGTGALLTLSRTAFVGIVVGALMLFVAFPRRRVAVVSVPLAFLALVHLFFRGVIGTLVSVFRPSVISAMEVGNENGRLADYAWAAPQMAARPLFGFGFGTLDPERGARIIDNQYLGLALETGALGVLAFAYLLWRAVSVPFRAGRRLGGRLGAELIGIAAAAAVFATCSATFDTIGFPQVTYLFFALSALGVVIIAEHDGAGEATGRTPALGGDRPSPECGGGAR